MSSASHLGDPSAFLGRLSRRHIQAETEAERFAALERRSQAAYKLARIDKRSKHNQPSLASGDASMMAGSTLMQARLRDLHTNNVQFVNAKNMLMDMIVGGGVQAYSDPFEPWIDFAADSNIDDFRDGLAFAWESDEWFDRWAESKQADVAEKRSWWDIQRMSLGECIETGDAILIKCRRRSPGRLVDLCYQQIEKDQLDTSLDRPAGPDVNKIVNGIEVDRQGRPVAYHVLEAHPYDDAYTDSRSSTSTAVPASRVMHLCSFRRPSQTVGTGWLASLGQTNYDRDSYLATEIQTAKKAALLAVIAYLNDPNNASLGLGMGDSDDLLDRYGNEEIALGSSPLAAQVGVGEDVKVVEANNRPNSDAAGFIRMLDQDQAGGAGLSIERFTRIYAKNYSASRAAHLDDQMHMIPLQQWFGRELVLPVRRAINAELAAAGRYSSVSASEFLARELLYQRFDVIGPGREQLDPEKETEAVIAKLRAGLSTLKRECAMRGLHWLRVLMQIAMESAISNHYGITLDYSKGQGANAADKPKPEDGENEAGNPLEPPEVYDS